MRLIFAILVFLSAALVLVYFKAGGFDGARFENGQSKEQTKTVKMKSSNEPDPNKNSGAEKFNSSEKNDSRVVVERIAPGIRNVTPDDVYSGPDLGGQEVARLPAAEPPKPAERPPEPILWVRPKILAPGLLEAAKKPSSGKQERQQIRLVGIKPVAKDKQCEAKERKWPCGRFAVAALRRFVRGRPIKCSPTNANDAKSTINTRCQLAGRDMAIWLVEQGWATPTQSDGEFATALDDALAAAKKAKRGQWRDRAPQL